MWRARILLSMKLTHSGLSWEARALQWISSPPPLNFRLRDGEDFFFGRLHLFLIPVINSFGLTQLSSTPPIRATVCVCKRTEKYFRLLSKACEEITNAFLFEVLYTSSFSVAMRTLIHHGKWSVRTSQSLSGLSLTLCPGDMLC